MKIIGLILYLFISFFSYSQCPDGPGVGCDGSGTSLDLYWIGTDAINSGNWNSPCSWRVGSISGSEPCQAPRSIDNVFFTSASFTGGGAPVVLFNVQARCNNFFIDPSINGLGLTPEFSLINPAFLEVYGNFTLQTNIIWTVVGGNATGPELFFKSNTSGQTISTAGHLMSAVQFDGDGGEWALQDDFNAGSLNFVLGYLNTSDGTVDYDMNLLTFDSDVQLGGSSANRRIDFNSSIITLTSSSWHDRYPYSTTNGPKTVWECRGTDTGDLNFNAGTSKIIFTATNPFLRLGGLTYNVIQHTGSGRFYDHFGPDPCIIDTLETNGYLYFHQEHEFNVLKINSVSKTHNFFHNQTITGDLIVTGNDCNPTVFKSEYNRTLTMPAVVSADPMDGFLINNLKCSDGTVGHIVNGFTLGTTTGWTITPPVTRDLYWVGDTDNNWSEPTNWSTSSTGVPLLAFDDCPPLQTDNVFFISPLANGDNIVLDETAFCNNQTWTITAPATATLSGSKKMNVYGNLTFDVDMNLSSSNSIEFFGNSGNTIFSAGKTFPSTTYFRDFSDYRLLDDFNFNYLYLFRQTNFNSSGYDLDGLRITYRVGATNLSGSTITLTSSTPWYIAGSQGAMTYDASSHVIFTNTSSSTIINGWGPNPHFPNFTLQSSNTLLRFSCHFRGKTVTFDGDVILNGSAKFRGDYGLGVPPDPLQIVSFNGDLTLNSGELYEFSVNTEVAISGNVSANGLCSSFITIEGNSGTEFDMDIGGVATFDFCNISDANATTPQTATNSLDLGNNTNFAFPPGASSTYYWRALSGSCPSCNYDGDWASTAGYWTTDVSDIEGVAGCIPGPFDNVVFDNASFSGGAANVTISSTVSCHDITATTSNVVISGLGNLKVTGSISSDGTLNATGFNGILDFVSEDVAGENIDFGGSSLGCFVNFANVNGTWTFLNNPFTTTKKLTLQSGTLNTNDLTLSMDKFDSNNSTLRTLNLGSSVIQINGLGYFSSIGSSTNVYTWNTENTTNFSFIKGTSILNFNNSNEPTIISAALDFHHVNFTSVSSIINDSPVLDIDGWEAEYMKFDCSARIYGNNSYDTLEFTRGNVYKLESGKTQTLNAPNGILISTGSAGNEIAIKATNTGNDAFFRKLNTGGAMSSFCFDYVSVEDNSASSDDALFEFFTGINSNDISASGIWNFSRPLFIMPSITSGEDQYICAGTSTEITWDIGGSGPYTFVYTENGIDPVSVSLLDGTPSYSVIVTPSVDSEFELLAFTADNCGVNTVGTIVDIDQWVYLPEVSPIALHNDSALCNLNNEAAFIHFHENQNGNDRPLLSVSDNADGLGLGNITTTIRIDPIVMSYEEVPYLQRRYGIHPTNNEAARVRLYFSQAELDALSVEFGSVLTLSDLSVTKYSNNVMNFSTPSTLLTVTSSGSISSGITTTPDILYVEVNVESFSHFVIHPISITPLPIELTSFTATNNQAVVDLHWITESEINNDYFTVERSADGMSYNEILRKNGAGNSSEEINYFGIDKNPLAGVSYYRLKQTDFDGNITYSDIVRVNRISESIVSIYPNPAINTVNIVVDKDQYIVNMYSVEGKLLLSLENATLIDIASFANGVYFVTITGVNKNLISAVKLIKE